MVTNPQVIGGRVPATFYNIDAPVVVQMSLPFSHFIVALINVVTLTAMRKWLQVEHEDNAAIPAPLRARPMVDKLFYVSVCAYFRMAVFGLDYV